MDSFAAPWMWAAFAAFVVVAVAIDLLMLRSQGAHRVSVKEALIWSGVWVALALLFAGGLWAYLAETQSTDFATLKTTEFITGYLIEKSLSVDNIFVFLMIFGFFGVPAEFQKRMLVLGVIGAIVLRAVMILAGALLIAKFHWILYLFGAFLLITGIKMFWFADAEHDFEKNPMLRFMRKHMNLTNEYRGEALSFVENGKRFLTPLAAVLVIIAITDVIFAVDSIPAIFAITEDPFIVMTANLFAILGLRALYFLLADLKDRFHLLTYGLAAVLVFVGAKMLLADVYKIDPFVSLGVVGAILAASMALSWMKAPKGAEPEARASER